MCVQTKQLNFDLFFSSKEFSCSSVLYILDELLNKM